MYKKPSTRLTRIDITAIAHNLCENILREVK